LRTFLRDFIDNDFNSTSKQARRTRKRVHNNDTFAPNEENAPANAPKWTIFGYNGSLKLSVEKYSDVRCFPNLFKKSNCDITNKDIIG